MSGCWHVDAARGLIVRDDACASGDACPWAIPALRSILRKVATDATDSMRALANGSVTRAEWANVYAARLNAQAALGAR